MYIYISNYIYITILHIYITILNIILYNIIRYKKYYIYNIVYITLYIM